MNISKDNNAFKRIAKPILMGANDRNDQSILSRTLVGGATGTLIGGVFKDVPKQTTFLDQLTTKPFPDPTSEKQLQIESIQTRTFSGIIPDLYGFAADITNPRRVLKKAELEQALAFYLPREQVEEALRELTASPTQPNVYSVPGLVLLTKPRGEYFELMETMDIGPRIRRTLDENPSITAFLSSLRKRQPSQGMLEREMIPTNAKVVSAGGDHFEHCRVKYNVCNTYVVAETIRYTTNLFLMARENCCNFPLATIVRASTQN